MNRKRVLVIAEKYDGGVKTHLEIIVNSLKDFDVCKVILRGGLLSPSRSIREDEEFFLEEFNIKNPVKLYKNIKWIKKFAIENEIDLIHLHSTIAGVIGILLSVMLWNNKVKFIYTPHAYYSQKPDLSFLKRFLVLKMEKLVGLYPSKVIHVSKGEEQHALMHKIVTKEKSVVIYNGIKKSVNVKSGSSQRLVIGNLARVDIQKNPNRFVEIAMHIIKNSTRPIQFVYGGDGPLLEEMKSLILKKKLQEKVKFIGYVEDKDAFFNGIDGYLSTSYYEGLPYSVVEAASFGIPLFLSDVIGHNEMICGNGILFDLHATDEEIGRAILEIMEKRELVEEQGRGSVEMFEQLFEEKKMIEHLNNLYSGEMSSV